MPSHESTIKAKPILRRDSALESTVATGVAKGKLTVIAHQQFLLPIISPAHVTGLIVEVCFALVGLVLDFDYLGSHNYLFEPRSAVRAFV